MCLVLRSWRTFRGQSAFRTWLLSIVVNVERDRRRRLRKTLPMHGMEFTSNGVQPVAQAEVNELHARIRAAMDELPDRQREVALLSLGEGLSPSEVALVLDTSEANVHTCLHLARKHIARAVRVDWHVRNKHDPRRF